MFVWVKNGIDFRLIIFCPQTHGTFSQIKELVSQSNARKWYQSGFCSKFISRTTPTVLRWSEWNECHFASLQWSKQRRALAICNFKHPNYTRNLQNLLRNKKNQVRDWKNNQLSGFILMLTADTSRSVRLFCWFRVRWTTRS
jgi:hypothetical protein